MNINQKQIAEYGALFAKVLNFTLRMPGDSIQLKSIEPQLTLRLDIPRKNRLEPFSDPATIQQAIAAVDLEIQKLLEKPVDFDKDPDASSRREKELEELSQRKSLLQSILSNPIEKSIKLLGEYFPDSKEVFLYLDNIFDEPEPEKLLIEVFIHEMMHAWSHNTSSVYVHALGENGKTVREIEEPMVEFATLLFLEELSKDDSAFEPIFKDALQRIQRKQAATGTVAAYGYGYYLWGLHRADTLPVLKWYFIKSYRLHVLCPEHVAAITPLLNPFYPRGKEWEVFCRIREAVLDYAPTLYKRIWTKPSSAYDYSFLPDPSTRSLHYSLVKDSSSQKVNLSGINLFGPILDSPVDVIENVALVGMNYGFSPIDGELFAVKDGPSVRLCYGWDDKGVFAPLIEEDLDQIVIMDYGEGDSLLLRRASDGKWALVSIWDIEHHLSRIGVGAGAPFHPMVPSFDIGNVIYTQSAHRKEETFLFIERSGKRYFVYPLQKWSGCRISPFEAASAHEWEDHHGIVVVTPGNQFMVCSRDGSKVAGPFEAIKSQDGAWFGVQKGVSGEDILVPLKDFEASL